MNEIKIKVDFEKRAIQKQGISLTSGDYNSTKIKFEFDKEYTERKVFELANEAGTAVFVSDISSSNELVLVGYVDVQDDNDYIKYTDTSDNIYWYDVENQQLYDSEYNESQVDINTLTKVQTEASIFETEGNYPFEVSLYGTNSKLTSATGFLQIRQESVRVDDEVVSQYIPVFDNLINETETLISALNEKIGEVETLNITATKVDNTTTVTITKKDGTAESIEINDGLTTSVNGIEQVNGNIDIDLDNIPDGRNRKIPTATSELANDSGFITNAVNNLTNYYLKTEADNSLSNKVDKETGKSLIADTEITRLSSVHNYDDTEVTADIAALAGSKVDKEIGKGLSTNDYTTTEKTKLSGIEAGAEVNTVDSVNGQTGAVVIDIPTKTSDLTNDSGFIDKEVDDLTNYVKNTDYANSSVCGVVKIDRRYGIDINANKILIPVSATNTDIDEKTTALRTISPYNLTYAVRSVRPDTSNTATTIAVNTIYDLGEQTSITINLPTGQLGDFIQVDFLSTATPTTLTITATSSALSDLDLVPEANKIYSLFFVYGRLETAVYGWKIAFSENTRTVI